MREARYDVVLAGVDDGADLVEICTKLSRAFGIESSAAASLIAAAPVVVKRDVNAELAGRFRDAITSAGANCELRLRGLDLEAAGEDAAPASRGTPSLAPPAPPVIIDDAPPAKEPTVLPMAAPA